MDVKQTTKRRVKIWDYYRVKKKSFAVSSFEELRQKARLFLSLTCSDDVTLVEEEDGTELDDEATFELTNDGTVFMALRSGQEWQPAASVGVVSRRSSVAELNATLQQTGINGCVSPTPNLPQHRAMADVLYKTEQCGTPDTGRQKPSEELYWQQELSQNNSTVPGVVLLTGQQDANHNNINSSETVTDSQTVLHPESICKALLRKHHERLLSDLDVTGGLLDRLYARHVIELRDLEEISSKVTTYDRNAALLWLLSKRPYRDYKIFVTALIDSNQSHVAGLLQEPCWISPQFKNRFENCKELLVENIIPNLGLLEELKSFGVYSVEEVKHILKQVDSENPNNWKKQSAEMLEILSRKSDMAILDFLLCLHKTNQGHLAKAVEQGLTVCIKVEAQSDWRLHKIIECRQYLDEMMQKQSWTSEETNKFTQIRPLLERLLFADCEPVALRIGSVMLYMICYCTKAFQQLRQFCSLPEAEGMFQTLFELEESPRVQFTTAGPASEGTDDFQTVKVMSADHRRLLIDNRTRDFLLQTMHTDTGLTKKLADDGVLSRTEIEWILAADRCHARSSRLLAIVIRKTDTAFDRLLLALRNSGCRMAADKLSDMSSAAAKQEDSNCLSFKDDALSNKVNERDMETHPTTLRHVHIATDSSGATNDDMKARFLHAVEAGDLPEVEKLTPYVDVNHVYDHGVTALYCASRNCNAEMAEILLLHGARVNVQTLIGRTPLHSAAEKGSLTVVCVLLEHGARRHIVDEARRIALHFAAHEGHVEVARLLITHRPGAKLNKTDINGQTAMHYAAKRGHLDVVRLLVESDANINMRDSVAREPQDIARQCGHDDVAKYLRNTQNIRHQTQYERPTATVI